MAYMTADDAIESLLAAAYRFQCGIRDAEIFLMGRVEEINLLVNEIKGEIENDLRSYGPPIPFKTTLLLSNQNSSDPIRIRKTLEDVTKTYVEDIDETYERFAEEQPRIWLASLISKDPSSKCFRWINFAHIRNTWEASTEGVVEYRNSDIPSPHPQKCFMYFNRGDQRGHKVNWDRLDRQEKLRLALTANSIGLMLALISHPLNYIVRESPQLTDHEVKRIESGKRYPDSKRPRYIIVDHEVLVGMNKPIGTHASPIPHKRRGHWMRLSKRCRHAKERGLEKVWVRDTYVGETDFVQNGRRYQVLLDFQDKVKAGVAPI